MEYNNTSNSKGYNNAFLLNNDKEIESPNNVESYFPLTMGYL